MSIPLIQKPEKDDINTSIIAIKRNIERINMLLGLVDNDSPDLSGFATKQELQDAVTELQPVDEVTIGNMQSVTSNAVAERFGEWVNVFGSGNIKGLETKNGKYLALHFQGYSTSYGSTIGWVTGKWVPQNAMYISFINGAFLVIGTNGSIISYSSQGGNFDLYGDSIVLIN